MDKFVKVSDVIDWFRSYGHMDQPIPFETLVTDLRDSIPAADVAPVVHGTPNRINRTDYETIYKEVKTENGKILYERHVFADNTNFVEYCSKCGKRLCSRFTNYCPNCGEKMKGVETFVNREENP